MSDEREYNATVVGKILLTPDLMILRVRTDEQRNEFKAGQYTSIGLLGKEPRSENSSVPLKEIGGDVMIKRPYSIASANNEINDFEFYISQVKSGQLTPRLFNLGLGDRLWVSNKIIGVFALHDVPDGVNIAMIATGTGLAPYISFLRSHIADHQNIKLAVIHGAAYQWDLGYYSELTFIQNVFKNFYYFPTLLKADETWTGLRGYIEEHLENGLLESKAGIEIDPKKTHFFLCGNPNMVATISNILYERGYTLHKTNEPGSLHIEKW
ncbi:MAG TPA: ferredoxin--NADP reductase [Candidatus Kapabacteria bacterium]|jgi:ferredoxin--NADP+ reductase|nr:ferredoxin--NADP reductase [Candidatus Kapabacteria bacterium]HOV92548.1 ferredoxin--NADP reductase [Candidatus Kapabacteria bacterium]